MHLPQLLDLPDEPRLSDRDFGAITEGSATATTRDAGMQWVGRVPGLYNSDGFKPTYCCTSAGSFNIPETPTIQGKRHPLQQQRVSANTKPAAGTCVSDD